MRTVSSFILFVDRCRHVVKLSFVETIAQIKAKCVDSAAVIFVGKKIFCGKVELFSSQDEEFAPLSRDEHIYPP